MDQELFAQAGIDCEDGLRRFNNNRTLYETVLRVFLQDTSFSEIKPALDAGDFRTAREKAHAVKGATGNLGMTELYELSIRFMQAVQENDIPSAETLHESMREAYDKARQAVATL